MDIDQERLAALYRAGTDRADRSSCPATEDLLLAAEGRLEADARSRFAAHLTTCSACAGEYRLAMELEPWADRTARARFPGARSVSAPRKPQGRFADIFLAVAAVIVVALGIAFLRGGGAGTSLTPTVRGSRPASWTSVIPIDGAIVAGVPPRLSWPSVPGAVGYEIALFDAESTLVWQSVRLASNTADLPPEVRAKLGAGGTFLWRVTAYKPGEQVLSPLMRFEVRP